MKTITTNEHNFKSHVGGFRDGNHYNYSECTICEKQTEPYLHGDFTQMSKEENKTGNCIERKKVIRIGNIAFKRSKSSIIKH